MHYENLARPAGLEPTTPWFVARCSNPTELRARESELYQKLDEAYPTHGLHAGGPCNPRTITGTLYALYPTYDVGRRVLRRSDTGNVRFTAVVAACLPLRRKGVAPIRTEDEAVEGQMLATLQRAASATAANRAHKIGIKILATRLGEGFDTAFAVCVLLGALWLLVSGYA